MGVMNCLGGGLCSLSVFLVSCLFFLCATAMEKTQSMGSGYNTHVLHTIKFCFNSISTGMQWAGWTTGCVLGSSVIDFVTGSLENIFVLSESLCTEVCVTVHSDMENIGAHSNFYIHTFIKSSGGCTSESTMKKGIVMLLLQTA